jgi:hypothetical protein
MKYVWTYCIVLILGVSGFTWMKLHVQSPDTLIVGTWNEWAWEYEKVNTLSDRKKLLAGDTMAQCVKDQLGKHLMIHSAEIWRFRPNGILELQGADTVKTVKWKLKGRGHMLELEYDNKIIEHYNLTELTPTQMILNFDSDMQVRGVAKLIFNKTDHVTKIQQQQNTGG